MGMYNVAIIGAGPAGIFTALELTKLRPEWKIVLIEKGQKIENSNRWQGRIRCRCLPLSL